MIDPVYILIRTSNRPVFFARMMETIKNQTYKNIVTIVHTDDPRDEYVTGDIIIKGTAFGNHYGSGPYNLYCNRLLQAIPPGDGWYHFIDDDDEYASSDVIERLVSLSKRDHINIGRVERVLNQGRVIFPPKWGTQKEFQTEIFFLHTDHKNKAKWPPNKGGDHYYSKQLTRILPTNWIDDLLICKAQIGKGHGNKLDANGKKGERKKFKPDDLIPVLGISRVTQGLRKNWIVQDEMKYLPYSIATELEKQGKVKITYHMEKVEPRIINIYG